MAKYIEHNLGLILLTIACIVSLFIFKDYGISWDEDTQRETGKLSYDYVFHNSKELLEWPDRDYGVAFELPLYIIEKAFGLEDSRDIYLSRHLVTHFFYLIGAFFFFLLVDLLYKNKWLATIGLLLILLHPRIYAHSYFNTKDIPFLAMFIVCLYLNAKAFKTKQIKHFIFLGIGYGVLINLRLMGVLLPFLTVVLLLFDFYKDKNKLNIKLGLILGITSLITLYISWPYLWSNPIENFFEAIINMSKFRWGGHMQFKGVFLKGRLIEWDYIPTWFGITTPIFYLLSGLFGTIMLVLHFIKNPQKYLNNGLQRNHLIFLICFFGPVLVVIALHSVLYNGWRQLYFIYPSFVMLCIYGLHHLIKNGYKIVVLISSFIVFTYVLIFMINNHPFQHVYFNKFVNTKTHDYLRFQYELDYWGTSYKQAFETILSHDKSASINIKVEAIPGTLNRMIIPSEERERINLVDNLDSANYYITTFRSKTKEHKHLNHAKWDTITVCNNSINTIFKLK